MQDTNKTKKQLISELAELRQRVAELEMLETEHTQVKVEAEFLLAAEREQRALTEALYWAGAVLSSTLSYEKVLDHMMEQIGRVVSYKAACIMHNEGQAVRIYRWRGYDRFEVKESIASTLFNIGDIPALRTVQETGWPLVIPYAADHNEWINLAKQPWIQSSVTVPIRTRNRLLGFLHVDSDKPGFYSQSDAERLHAFANQAAIALENARRYDRAREEIARRVKALKRERNFVSAILNTIEALVVVLDAEGRIIRFNLACERITGHSIDEVTDKYLWDLFLPPEEIASVKTIYENLRGGQYPIESEGYWITKDGNRRLIAWSNTILFNNDNEVEYIISTGIDITKQRQSEKEREKLIEELEAFSHTVAHDLQEPVGRIVGFADALLQYDTTMTAVELQENLQIIVRNSQKMSNIIDELLLLAGVRKQTVMAVPLKNMSHIVSEALHRLAYLIEEHQAEIVLPTDWPVVLGYGPWIEEVWVNYLSNAIKYGGRPPCLELGATTLANGMVSYWVRDNGTGLTSREQARLFTPFTRLNQTRAEGYGLGLSIVQRIIEKLGGYVGVESDNVAGEGSIFSFTLPAVTPPGNAGQPQVTNGIT